MNSKRLYLLVIVAFVFAEVVARTHLAYFIINDDDPAIYSSAAIYNQLFSWSSSAYTGVPAIAGSLTTLFWDSVGFVLTALTNGAVASSLILWIMISISAVSVYFIVIELSGESKIGRIGGLAGALFFTAPMVQLNYFMPEVLLPFALLFILKVSRSIERTRRYYKLDMLIAIIGTGMMIGFGGSGYLIQAIMFLAAFGFIVLINIKNKLVFLQAFTIICVFALLINASWLLNPLFFSHSQYTSFFAAKNILTPTPPPFAMIADLLGFSSFQYYFMPLYMQILLIVAFIVSLYAVFYQIKGRSPKSKFVIAIFFGYLLLMAFNATNSTAFGAIRNEIARVFPYIGSVSIVWSSISSFAATTFAVLFALGVIKIMERSPISGKKPFYLSAVAFALFMPILLFSGSLMNMHPSFGKSSTEYIYQGYNYHIYLSYGIPGYVLNASSYINSQPGDFAVATIPSAGNWQTTTWYTGVNIYTDLIYNHPVFSGGTVNNDELIEGGGKASYDKFAGMPLSMSTINPENVSKDFGAYGIKYILLQTDAINKPKCWCEYYPFNLTSIEAILNNSPNVTIYRKFGNATLYEINNFTPLVKANSNISYKVLSPVRIKVNVANATHSYNLLFRQTYSPDWLLFYGNGTEVNAIHINNGIFNEWEMNRTGTYSFYIYYELQEVTDLGWIVSVASLCLSIALFARKEHGLGRKNF